MKLSVSLPESDVATLDEYVRATGLSSRSAAIQRAIRALRRAELEREYEEATEDWEASGEGRLWDTAVGDGLRR